MEMNKDIRTAAEVNGFRAVENDRILREAFENLPELTVPAELHSKVMQKVENEAKRKSRRVEILSRAAVVAAFLLLAGLAAMVIRDKVVPLFAGFILDIHMLMFCTYIGLLALSLLGLDYIIRRHLSRKHAHAGPDGK